MLHRNCSKRDFVMPSFSDAGNTDALLLDMYNKSQRKKAVKLRLPGVPQKVTNLLSGALTVVKSTASLPIKVAQAADVLHGLERKSQEKKPASKQVFNVCTPSHQTVLVRLPFFICVTYRETAMCHLRRP